MACSSSDYHLWPAESSRRSAIPPYRRLCPGMQGFPASGRLCLLLIVLLVLPAVACADNYIGGLPLTTVRNGTVTGDLWIDATPPSFTTTADKTFTLPAAAVASPGRIQWARLYVSRYAQNMGDDIPLNFTTSWDGDGIAGYEQVWHELGHRGFTNIVNGGNDNSAFPGHGTGEPYTMINDHEIRVTSDYLLWYDVKDLIKNQTIFVNYTRASTDNADGRVKMITLVVAFNDPASSNRTQYWVNQGADECSYLNEMMMNNVAVGTTTFDTEHAGPFTSATLTVNYIASHNGFYAFPDAANDQCASCSPVTIEFAHSLATGYDVQAKYSGVMHWDITSRVTPGQDSTLAYSRNPAAGTGVDGGYYKNALAFLVLKSTISPLPPVANFTANVTSGTAPLAVLFNDTSTGGVPSSWSWDFNNDGIVDSTDRIATYIYGTAGNYTVKLTVTNAAGPDSITRTGYINVTSPQPSILAAAFTNSTPRSGTVPLTVQFKDTSTGSPSAWNWTFGDTGAGNTSMVQNPSHTYTQPGSYPVNLTVTGPGGTNTSLKTGYVTVTSASGSPSAAFTAAPVSGTAPLTVQFTDESAGTPTAWAWDFDNNGVVDNTIRNPSFTYTSAGTYTVKLRVTNLAGSDEQVKTGYITVYAQPVISLLPSTQSVSIRGTQDYQIVMDHAPLGLAGYDMIVNLANTSVAEITGVSYPSWARLTKSPSLPNQSVLIGGTDTGHQIEAGASALILANITVRGDATGITPVMISAIHPDDDNGNRINPSTNSGTVITGSYAGPVAAFTANTTSGPAPLTVQFTDQSQASPTAWAWDFNNDGVIDSNNQNPSCTYTNAGTYAINLTVTNPNGSNSLVRNGYVTATTGSGITVTPLSDLPPVASFAASPLTGTAPLSVQFSDQSTGNPTGWSWDFGDGNISTDKNPLHSYASAGTYTVKLVAANAAGTNTSTRSNYITVTAVSSGAPVAAFSASTLSGTVPLSVTFTDKSSNSPTGWYWDFGNGQTSSLSSKTITYTSAGVYTVTLTASNSHGSNSATQYITVNTATGLPGVAFSATPVSGAAPLTVTFTDQSSGSPTSWQWDFNNDGTTDSTLQNPTYNYPTAGTYTVKLTAINGAGSDSLTKSSYISVTSSSTAPDLTVNSMFPNAGRAGGTVIALEQNPVNINIRNIGTQASTATTVKLQSSDGFSGTASVPGIASGSNATVVVTDTTVRSTEGSGITYTATVDPDNLIPESSEGNNVRTGSFSVEYNGYKGKRYWTGGSDVITRHTFDLNGGLVHSFGDSVYKSGSFGNGWTTDTANWQASDLVIPSDATVKAAYLYAPYTWDNDHTAPDSLTMDFNGQRISRSNWFHDKSNFGTYADYEYGLLTYDVTSQFRKNAANTATLTRSNADAKFSPYGFTLAVVYEDSSSSRKQIFINEEFDILGASASDYGTTPEEATAYIPFSGMTVDMADMQSATLITFVPSGDGEGNLLFNGNVVASNVWDYGSSTGPQVAVDTRDVKSRIQATGNTAGIQSTDNGGLTDMAAEQQFLVVDLGGSTTTTTTTITSSSDPYTGTFTTASTTPEPLTTLSLTIGAANPAGNTNGPGSSGSIAEGLAPLQTDKFSNLAAEVQVQSSDQIALMTLPQGTRATDRSGQPIAEVSIQPMVSSSVPSPESALYMFSGLAYQCGPDGARFSPAITITFTLTQNQWNTLTANGREPVIREYSTSTNTWETLSTATDPATRSVKAPATHFSDFAVFSEPVQNKGISTVTPATFLGDDASGTTGTVPTGMYPGLAIGGFLVIGATGTLAYRKGWIPNGISGRCIWAEGSSGSISCVTLDPYNGIIRHRKRGTLIPRTWLRPIIIIVVTGGFVVAAAVLGLHLPFGSFGAVSSGNGHAGNFDIIPTVEDIKDLDMTNHAPDYPTGFSAQNGLLFVYHGTEPHKIADLELQLSKGTNTVTLTSTTAPPAANAVNPKFSSYFEEMGNGDETLDNGEWLMVYADNCYDSSRSDSEPRGKVLVWQPQEAGSGLEVPLKDTVGYSLKDTATDEILRQGTLAIIPSTP